MRSVLVVALVVAACGDNNLPEIPEVVPCTPPVPELPATGMYIDPYAAPLEGCVEGGLRDLPGRWFVVAPTELFSFSYPQYEGTCDTGFRRAGTVDVAGESLTWSDGTRLFTRSARTSPRPPPNPDFERIDTFTACLRADDTLVASRTFFDSDRGEVVLEQTGERFGPRDEPAAGLTVVGELAERGPGSPIVAYNVVAAGDQAYVVGPSGFDVIDVANPAAPVPRSHVEGFFNDVRVIDANGKRVAFLSSGLDFGTDVVDVTDPENLVMLASLPEYSHSVHVATSGNRTFLYLATYGDSVPRYDVTDPTVPIRMGAAPVPGPLAGVHDLFVDGDRIYANNTTEGLVVFDADAAFATSTERGRMKTSYSHASWVGTTTSGHRVVLHGDEGMTGPEDLGAFLRILDGDPASPTYLHELSRYQSRPQVGIHNIQLVGDRVYLSYYQDGIRILDIADPTQPREVAHYNTWDPATAFGGAFEGALGVRPAANGLVFVADSERGLVILRED